MKPAVLVLLLAIGAWPAEAQLHSQVVVSGYSGLVDFVADPLYPGVHYLVQQSGVIRVMNRGTVLATPLIDLRGSIGTGGERGLLGMAFAPDATSGRVFLNFTNTSGHTVVARFLRSSASPFVLDPATRFDLQWPDGNRFITQPYANHNGGHLAFGPDGHLYIGLGDGGSSNDPNNYAQDPNSLLGKMLRVDVNVASDDSRGYRVPPDNPFLDAAPIAALGEIWAFGLRNPWRYSFDNPAHGGTGALFIGDVGQGAREEINFEPAASGGRNYGWRIREGSIATPGVPATSPAFEPLTNPMLDYARTGAATVVGTSVTGGYVYRGRALGPEYVGRYFFADFGNGRVWSVGWQPSPGGAAVVTDIVDHTTQLGNSGPISSLAVDTLGELYIVHYSGTVARIARNQPYAWPPTNLRSQVSGRTVTLTWTGSTDAMMYQIEVGSAPGATNLAQFLIVADRVTFTATEVPDGVYYVRVRSFSSLGGLTAASNEIVVAGGCPPPSAPTAFSQIVSGRLVGLSWAAGADATSFVLDVGSNVNMSDLATIVLPGSFRTVSGMVAPGRYFTRLRAFSACGSSSASPELAITVP